jgi:hypothetical protein
MGVWEAKSASSIGDWFFSFRADGLTAIQEIIPLPSVITVVISKNASDDGLAQISY